MNRHRQRNHILRPVPRRLAGLAGVPTWTPPPMPPPMPEFSTAPAPQFTEQQRAYLEESIEQARPKVWDALLIAGVTGGFIGWLIGKEWK